jgi:GNAT superfamily N-acetyltransferase
MQVRAAEEDDVEALARLWWSGWRDAHLDILPEELARLRTLDSFRERTRLALADVRTVGPVGAPVGFHLLKGDELYQLYVAAEARGSGVAAALIADAEARLRARGVDVAWLACAIGNARAARFYEKAGWRMAGVANVPTETSTGLYPLEVWRYEKHLGPGIVLKDEHRSTSPSGFVDASDRSRCGRGREACEASIRAGRSA